MSILSLGYLGMGAKNIPDWAEFGARFLGLQIAEQTAGSLALRMDERSHRINIEADPEEGLQYVGWELADSASLQAMAVRLEAAGVAVRDGGPTLAARRKVRELIWVLDPAGNRVELFWGQEAAATPFQPGRNIAGFRVGQLGMGHAVLTCESADAVLPFYTDILGFGLSDYMKAPFKAYFMHVNQRHHSLALVETGRRGVHHIMMELVQFDDVGHAHDLAQLHKHEIAVTFGRHANDYMTSFYVRAPSGVMIEYGWGGRLIDPATWQAAELTDGPSSWGHNRSWLSDEANAVMHAQQQSNADHGLRQPVQVLPGNHVQMKDR